MIIFTIVPGINQGRFVEEKEIGRDSLASETGSLTHLGLIFTDRI